MGAVDYQELAEKSIRGEVPNREEMRGVLSDPAQDLQCLLQAALRVREHFCGRTVHLHMLINARSGLCPEDCHYCSQSAISQAPISKYPLLSRAQLVEGAYRAKAARAVRYCIVTRGRGARHRGVDARAAIVRGSRGRGGGQNCR